jgi:hypothetical protein
MNKDWNYQLVATLMVSNNKKEEIMIEQTQMVQPVNASVQQNDKAARTLADLDRVMLADVRKHWVDFQSSRNRDAIYGYLHMVFMQVDWWARNPLEKDEALRAAKQQNPKLAPPEDPFAAVIACTADPKKVDDKTRSKWSRILRYAARYKPEKELLRDFLQRKGGINKCAARYTRRLGRKAKAKAVSQKKRCR